MATQTVIPTRMELTRLKKKLVTAQRGHKLLKDKRDELMRQFLELVRENKALRERVEQAIRNADKSFVLAGAVMQEEVISTALIGSKQQSAIEVSTKNVMSVEIPKFSVHKRTPSASDIYSYGYAFTSADLDNAVGELADLLPDLIHLAECEKAAQLLSAEIEKTRRRVNALEHVMIPETQEQIKAITMKLDENERSTQIRLMKVKDMVLMQQRQHDAREGL